MSNRVLIDQSNNTVTTDTTSTQNNVILSPDNPDVVRVVENTSNIVTIGVPGPRGPQGTVGLQSSYKVYTALLTQEGIIAPVPFVLENTLGVTITYSRVNIGQYLLTASEGIFLQDKTWAVINTPSYDGNGPFALQIGRISDTECYIYSYENAGPLADLGTNEDRTSIEIRVYN